MSLHPCPSCARHVLAGEHVCPFCDAALPEPAPHPDVVGRLGRAAAFAAGAALMLSGCGGDRDRGPAVDTGVIAVDGGGPMDSGTATDAGPPVDANEPDVGLATPYGAPPSRARTV